MELRAKAQQARKAEGLALLRAGAPIEEVCQRLGVATVTAKEWRSEMRNGYVPEPSGPVITPRLWSQAERDTPMGVGEAVSATWPDVVRLAVVCTMVVLLFWLDSRNDGGHA